MRDSDILFFNCSCFTVPDQSSVPQQLLISMQRERVSILLNVASIASIRDRILNIGQSEQSPLFVSGKSAGL
jgi:hypothetical protein